MNVTGRCDKVYFDTSLYNSSKHRALLIGYHNPLLLRLNQSLDIQAFRSFHNFDHESAYHEFLTGFNVKHIRGAHQFQYECAWREVMLVRNATLAQFADAGHTLKSSLRHQVLVDARDSSLLPTRGGALSLAHEVAGLGGNVQFLKHESALQLNWALLPSLSFGVLARGGAIFAPQSTPIGSRPPIDSIWVDRHRLPALRGVAWAAVRRAARSSAELRIGACCRC
jgi:outer membrane protein assembly factor BamA